MSNCYIFIADQTALSNSNHGDGGVSECVPGRDDSANNSSYCSSSEDEDEKIYEAVVTTKDESVSHDYHMTDEDEFSKVSSIIHFALFIFN